MGWGHLNRQHSPEITGLPPGWGAGSPPILWSNLGSAKLIFRWSGAISHILASLPVCQLVWLGLVYLCECMPAQSCPTLQSHELQPAMFLCPWDFPGKNTGVGCPFLLQGIFPTQGSNLCLSCLLHCGRVLLLAEPCKQFWLIVWGLPAMFHRWWHIIIGHEK